VIGRDIDLLLSGYNMNLNVYEFRIDGVYYDPE
jgi:hypothetical protein